MIALFLDQETGPQAQAQEQEQEQDSAGLTMVQVVHLNRGL